MIKIVTDSTACIEKNFAEENDITVIPLKICFKDEEFFEGFPGEFDAFYQKLEETKEIPKTSLPSPESFKEVFKKITDAGDEVICITLSSSLSGTFNSARLAAEDFKDTVTVIDSTNCCQSILFLVEAALEKIQEGRSRQYIAGILDEIKHNTEMYFVPESLDYLKHGGRIGLLTASLGNILKIKPVLLFKKGTLTRFKKILGMSRAVSDLASLVAANVKKIYVCCIGKSVYFEKLKEKIKERFAGIQVRFGEISPVMGAHVGPGTLGLACLNG